MADPMSDQAKKLLVEALRLPAAERARLGTELIASLDDHLEDEVETAWAAEINRRLQRIESERDPGESWAAVQAEIEATLQRK